MPLATTTERGKMILLAEDDPRIRKLLNALLQEGGFTVIVANDGFDALEQSKAHGGKIDLLLSDIHMPRITGIELATILHRQWPEMKVLLISGLGLGNDALNENWQFLSKPFTPNMLKEKVRAMFEEQRAQDIPTS